MLSPFTLQPDTFAANSANSFEIKAPRSNLWGAFPIVTSAIHVSHQIYMVATPQINPIQMGLWFTCRPSSEKTISHVFLNPLNDNRTLKTTGNRT